MKTATSPIQFVDTAKQSGVDFKFAVEGPRPCNILQTIGNGCALLDFDGDGNLDLLLVSRTPVLYRGNGKGQFENVSASVLPKSLSGHFLGCAVGDVDNDGFPEIYLTGHNTSAMLMNRGGKQFVNATSSSGLSASGWQSSASFADVDRDGLLDLYVCRYVEFGPKTVPQLCDFSGVKASCGPRHYTPQKGTLYKNLGGGRFADITAKWAAGNVSGKGLGVAIADIDGKGHPSIAIANDEMPGDLLHNTVGRMRNIGVESATAHSAEGSVHGGMGIDWGDYDDDGLLDLAVTTYENETKTIYRNDGGNLFVDRSNMLGLSSSTRYVGFGTKWLDVDNDGRLDIVMANGHVLDNIEKINKGSTYRQPTLLYRNVDGRRFEELSNTAGEDLKRPIVGRGLAVGDIDNDGRIDIVVVDSEGVPLILMNRSKSGNAVMLKLSGKKSNRDGIGALVRVKLSDGRTLLRRCARDGSYMSSSDVRVHVGVGTSTNADVEVQWPSGANSRHRVEKVNAIVEVKEP